MSKFILAIPFFKNENFIDQFISWHHSPESSPDKLLLSDVIVFNDCPLSEDSPYLKRRCEEVGFKYHANSKNIGYLKTVNLAYALARERSCNLILLNSDTVPLPGFISEINNCFLSDSMLGVVSARSNNATICNLYNEPDYFDDESSILKYITDIKKFAKYVPSTTYTPVVTGFCFAIEKRLIESFDGFDEIFTVGYEEENEYCLRVAERGFRIGIANRAFVAHMEGRSFGLTKTRNKIKNGNALIIRNKYPYYDGLIENYATSLDKKSQSFISQSIENETSLLIDARVLSSCHNGSNKFIVEFLRAISTLGLKADVIIDKDAVRFHDLNNSKHLCFIENTEKIYEYGFMLGQPMHHSALLFIPSHSLVSTCIFFDTIAHDCPQLRSTNSSLDSTWSLLPYIYSDISFISEHSMRQFALKFGAGTSDLHSHLLPINFEDKKFASTDTRKSTRKSAIIFGNKFLHKGQDLLLNELSADELTTYYVLGPTVENVKSNIIFLKPGATGKDELDLLMHSVDYILMPSFSEGFGFPLLEALSYGKTIYCRDIDCYREIISCLPAEKAKLIKLVQSFKSPLSPLSINTNESGFKFYKDYQDYVLAIFSDIEKRSPDKFMSLLKLRLHIISSTNRTTSTKVSMGALKTVYRFFLRTPLGGAAIKLKGFVFKFQSFRRFME